MTSSTWLCVALTLVVVVGPVAACSKAEYAAKFGEAYRLLAQPATAAPAVFGGAIEAKVSYTSACRDGGSLFEVSIIEKEDFPPVAVLVRGEPECDEPDRLPEARQWTGFVAAALPAGTAAAPDYVAFPPDSDFELYILRAKATSSLPKPTVPPAVAVDKQPADEGTAVNDTRDAADVPLLPVSAPAAAAASVVPASA